VFCEPTLAAVHCPIVMERVLTGGNDLTRARVGWEIGTVGGYLSKGIFL